MQYKMAIGLGGQVATKVPVGGTGNPMKKKKRKLIVLPSLPVKKQAYAAAAGNALLEQQYKVAAAEIAPIMASVIDSYGGVAAIGTVNLDPTLQAALEKIPEGCSKKLKKIVDLYPDYLVALPEARLATAFGYENGTVSPENVVNKEKMQQNHREKKVRDGPMNYHQRNVPKKRGHPRLVDARDQFYQHCMEADARVFEAAVAEVRAARVEVFGVGGQPNPVGQAAPKSMGPGIGAQPKYASLAPPSTYPPSVACVKAPPVPPKQVVPLKPGMSTAKVKVKQAMKKKKGAAAAPQINMKKIQPGVHTAIPAPTTAVPAPRPATVGKASSALLNIKPEVPEPNGTTSLPFLQHVRTFLKDKNLPPGDKISLRVVMMDPEANKLHSQILAEHKKPMVALLENYPEHFKITRQGMDAHVALNPSGSKKPLMLKP